MNIQKKTPAILLLMEEEPLTVFVKYAPVKEWPLIDKVKIERILTQISEKDSLILLKKQRIVGIGLEEKLVADMVFTQVKSLREQLHIEFLTLFLKEKFL